MPERLTEEELAGLDPELRGMFLSVQEGIVELKVTIDHLTLQVKLERAVQVELADALSKLDPEAHPASYYVGLATEAVKRCQTCGGSGCETPGLPEDGPCPACGGTRTDPKWEGLE